MPKLWVGGGLELSPMGSFKFAGGGMSQTQDSQTSYGLDAIALYHVNDLISVGFAPRYVLHLIPKDATGDSASLLDLRALVAVGKTVAPKIHVFGFGGLGYSIIMLPSDANDQPNPKGLTLSFGAGAGYVLGPKLMATAQLGYELGFQSASVSGTSVDFQYNHLFLGVGIMAAVGS